MTPNNTFSGIRKAAIVVCSLDREAADRLLDQMPPQQARQVREMVLSLGPVDPEEQNRVIHEFFRFGPPAVPVAQATRAERGDVADESVQRQSPPFGRLRETEVEKLADVLSGERPQTVALVLSHLLPEQAGGVLARLAPEFQVNVVRRLLDLEETDPDVLQEVEQCILTRLSDQVRWQRRRVAGLSAVAGIVEAAQHGIGLQILDNLASHDPQLARRLGPEPFHFDDLYRLDDHGLAAVFEAVDAELVQLALVGAPEAFVQRILWQLPPEQAAEIRHRLDHPGPTRLSDVEEARRQIEEAVRRLAVARRIQLPRADNMFA